MVIAIIITMIIAIVIIMIIVIVMVRIRRTEGTEEQGVSDPK